LVHVFAFYGGIIEVLNAEKDNIRILQRIEDIRGLVLDLML